MIDGRPVDRDVLGDVGRGGPRRVGGVEDVDEEISLLCSNHAVAARCLVGVKILGGCEWLNVSARWRGPMGR